MAHPDLILSSVDGAAIKTPSTTARRDGCIG
jgi:hypothetical protein